MADFFELDFHLVHASKSGDAISLRYEVGGETFIHVVDGGYSSTGDALVAHIRAHYSNPTLINNVVVTHNDTDHAMGVRAVLENFEVETLWMLRPWIYADHLIQRFATYNSVEHLRRRLREIYSNLAALEDIALARGIDIKAPFQGERIGPFTVLAPSTGRFVELVVTSEKTPQELATLTATIYETIAKAVRLVQSAWGVEAFSSEETSAENDMSVVQFGTLCEKRVLLTGDAGRAALAEAADYALQLGHRLPGVDYVQIPHHGSRRNVSSEVLDRWLGPKLPSMPIAGTETFTAIVSAAEEDEHHPRKAVLRAFAHRGASILSTDDGMGTKCVGINRPWRQGWVTATPVSYPIENEE